MSNGRKPPAPVRSNSKGQPVKMTKGCVGSALAFIALPLGALLPIGHFLGVY
jgi:hypothetical protein